MTKDFNKFIDGEREKMIPDNGTIQGKPVSKGDVVTAKTNSEGEMEVRVTPAFIIEQAERRGAERMLELCNKIVVEGFIVDEIWAEWEKTK